MRRFLFILILCVVMLPAASPAQEMTAETAHEICRAYIDHPEDFKEIKTEKCGEGVVESVRNKDILLKEKDYLEREYEDRLQTCFDLTDKVTGQKKIYGLFNTGGTCPSNHIAKIDLTLEEIDLEDGDGSQEIPLNYKGMLVVSEDSSLLLGYDRKGESVYCVFSYHVSGWKAAQPEDSPVCQAFSKGEYQTTRQGISSEEEGKYPEYPASDPYAKYEADLNNDGEKEKVIAYRFASNSRCGCISYVFKISDQDRLVGGFRHQEIDVISSPELVKLDEKLENLTERCGESYSGSAIITISGRDYVLLDRDITPKEKKVVYTSHDLPVRELYGYEKGEFVKVCTQEAQAKRVIAHEVSAPSELYYNPL